MSVVTRWLSGGLWRALQLIFHTTIKTSLKNPYLGHLSDKTYLRLTLNWGSHGIKQSTRVSEVAFCRICLILALGKSISGLFRYTLQDCRYKTLDLKTDDAVNLPCIAQLNPQRAVNRRKREEFDSMNEIFNDDQFNFKKIKTSEVLLQMDSSDKLLAGCDHSVMLNISPIEYGHVLLAPFLQKGLPQRCTRESLLLAFDMVQLSSQPSK